MSRGEERKEPITVTVTELDALEFGEAVGMSRIELDLKMSLFREGFLRGVKESLGYLSQCKGELRQDADPDWRAGFETGLGISNEALARYRAMFGGGE